MPYNCLYLNKGNNSSVKGWILTKLTGYRESVVLIICTKNELNLTNRYWDRDPDGRTEWTDGRTDDAKTISLRLRRGIIKMLVFRACVHKMLVRVVKREDTDQEVWSGSALCLGHSWQATNVWNFGTFTITLAGIFLGLIWGQISAPSQFKMSKNFPKWCISFPIS